MKQPQIIWLASYPKSGNTWFRIFLTNLLEPEKAPASINKLHATPIASSRSMFDNATGLSAANLTFDEIDRIRPELYQYLSDNASTTLFHKIHDAYSLNPAGIPLVPAPATKGVIYFIRNPLDVIVSYAAHMNKTTKETIAAMQTRAHGFCKRDNKLHNQLRQQLYSWAQHVESWEQSGLPMKIIRYEDMVEKPFETFREATGFAGINKDDKEIKKALTYSQIEKLQLQEEKEGFKEKSPRSKVFFRKGIPGNWREFLTPDDVESFISTNKAIMIKYGYLSADEQPVC